ncbi:hypothetical protein M407DRAFT_26262 [Tulasnella calospora MUT 4182]|uniref:Extracellular membrane protein CFEM domain-containing protein n=1 Tax=Tulasnella calospora MUT 4182 TaxID=1051891 RepID=A0A0C3QEN0_9AGAM|nr:hypothetical protein M407DRAFT_26262 [Tulasnella calospora MUT 4182]
MHFSTVVLAIAAAAIGSTSASSVAPRALASINHASSSLLSRQVDAACVPTCSPAQDELATCGVEPTCLCGPSLASELTACANCRVNADPTLRAQLESAWDQYSSGCASLGRPVSGGLDGTTGGNTPTPSVIATPTTTTTPAAVFTPSGIVTSAAAGRSSAAPAASTSSAASSSGSSDTGGLVAHSNSASPVRVGGALGVFVAGVIAALL